LPELGVYSVSTAGLNEYITYKIADLLDQKNYSEVTYTGNSADATTSTPTALSISSDGSRVFLSNPSTDVVDSYELTTPNDITTKGTTSVSLAVGAQNGVMLGNDILDDGSEIYTVGQGNIFNYDLATNNLLSTGTFNTTRAGLNPTNSRGLHVKRGTKDKVWLGALDSSLVYQYNINTPGDLNTLDLVSEQSYDFGSAVKVIDCCISNNGNKGLFLDNTGNKILIGTLATANEVQTLTDVSDFLDLAPYSTNAMGIAVTPDEKNLYVLFFGDKKIYQFDLILSVV